MASLDESITISPSIVSVQELIKRPLGSVPESFIRLEQAPHEPPLNSDNLPSIPTIDLKKLLESSDKSLNDELKRLHFSCKEWGMFQLVNHGVSSSFLQKLRHEIEEFFKLPLEEKVKYKQNPGENEGYGNVVRTEKNLLDWGDRLLMTINPISLRKPHLFPELPASLRNTLETYIKGLQEIAIQILRSLALCLDIDKDLIIDIFEEDKGLQLMKMSYYPPCLQPELVVGLTPHSDATAITILHQINCVDGLQIKRNGVWLPVNILPDVFIVNIGDVMEILSNGTYRSIEHRAMVNTEHERITLALFFNPKLDAEVGPAASLIDPNNPASLFRRITLDKFVKEFFSHKMDGKSHLDRLRLTGDDEVNETQ
ncbi:protein SRG1-like [Punica granatum]|nr:protein SRG1-like [Punica granatum]PKI69077.1 hypothetical protein CRG98_010546 [Punica granatum]